MFLVVGLGNPGRKYDGTRHNVGFETVALLARRHRFSGIERRMQAEVSNGTIGDADVLLVRPMTYMNLSGDAVGGLVQEHDAHPSRVVVVHDDLDFEPGQVRVKSGGGHGGNNGLRSIVGHIGRDFPRVRIGIGKPPGDVDGADWVLSRPIDEDRTALDDAIVRAADAVEAVVTQGVAHAMNEFNRREKQEPEKEESGDPDILVRSTGNTGEPQQGD